MDIVGDAMPAQPDLYAEVHDRKLLPRGPGRIQKLRAFSDPKTPGDPRTASYRYAGPVETHPLAIFRPCISPCSIPQPRFMRKGDDGAQR